MITNLEMAVLEALKTSAATSPLYKLICNYIREMRTRKIDESTVIVQLDKYGYRRYKAQYKRKSIPPPVDTEGIQRALNKALAGFKVSSIVDRGEYVEATIVEDKE